MVKHNQTPAPGQRNLDRLWLVEATDQQLARMRALRLLAIYATCLE